MRLSWIIWVGSHAHILTRGRLHTHRRGSNVTVEAETGVIQTQAKERWQHHQLEETRKRLSSRASRGRAASLMPWFQPRDMNFGLLVSRTVRKLISVVSITYFAAICYRRHR